MSTLRKKDEEKNLCYTDLMLEPNEEKIKSGGYNRIDNTAWRRKIKFKLAEIKA